MGRVLAGAAGRFRPPWSPTLSSVEPYAVFRGALRCLPWSPVLHSAAGASVIAANREALGQLLRQDGRFSLSLPLPLPDDPAGREAFSPFRALFTRFSAGWDACGCGAAVLDAYRGVCAARCEHGELLPEGLWEKVD